MQPRITTPEMAAVRSLGVETAALAKAPDISSILKRTIGGKEKVIALLRFSRDPNAQELLEKYDTLKPTHQKFVPIEALCLAADVAPESIIGAAMLCAKTVMGQESALLTVMEHPGVVRSTINFAKNLPGANADRRMIHEAVGYLQTPKGGNVNVNFGGASSEDEGDDEVFESAFPSVNKSLEDWGKSRRKMLEGGK